MKIASWVPLGRALGGLLGRLGGLLGRLEAILEASWAILVAWVGFLGRHGSPGEPEGGAVAAQAPLVIGAVQAAKCAPEGGGPLRRLTETLPDQHLAF